MSVGKEYLTIAQASDFHICKNGEYAYEVSDSLSGLSRFIKNINKLPFPIDFLAVTGDLSSDGSISSYEIIKKHLEKINIPYYLIPGNHDKKKNMAEVFKEHEYLQNIIDGRLIYSFFIDNKKIIFLDSASDDESEGGGGNLTEGVLEALEAELNTKKETIVFLHHPPFSTGIGFMDKQCFKNRKKLLEVLKNTGNIILIGCGHIHREIFVKKEGLNICTAPSTAMQLELNLNKNAPGDFVLETAGYLIHRTALNNDAFSEIMSYTVRIPGKPEEEIKYPFND